MKNLLTLLLAFACTTAFAQTNSDSDNIQVDQLDTTRMAKVYVIRSTGHVASAVNLRVVVNDKMMCKVKNNRYAVIWVNPGTHMFNATSWDKPGTPEKFAIKIPVEAGKTYYTTVHLKQKLVSIDIWLEEVTLNTAAPMLAKYKRDECD